MAFVDSTGRKLTEREVVFILRMVKESIKNQSEHFAEFIKKVDEDGKKIKGPTMASTFTKVYADRLDTIEQDFARMFDSDNEINIEETLINEFKGLNRKAIAKYKKNLDNAPDYDNDFILSVASLLYDRDLDPRIPIDLGDDFNSESARFKFADVPMEGIENIADFNVNTQRIATLNQSRSGNSTTLTESDEPEEKQKLLQNKFKFDAAAELSRLKATELKNKNTISFLDIYNVFTELNQYVRMGDSEGGQLRGHKIAAGAIKGVSSNEVAHDMFKLTNNIARYMNEINNVQDPLLKKTRAIQLAAYTYQMAISAHLFADGNGRSCRLLADTILQTFGLPPHIPSKDEIGIGVTLGYGLNFDRGAEVFMAGVKAADEAIKEVANGPKPVNSEITSNNATEKQREVKAKEDEASKNILANADEAKKVEEEKKRIKEANPDCTYVYERSDYKKLFKEIKNRIDESVKKLADGNVTASEYGDGDNLTLLTSVMNQLSLFESMANLKANKTLNSEDGAKQVKEIESHLNDEPSSLEGQDVISFFMKMNRDAEKSKQLINSDLISKAYAAFTKKPMVEREKTEAELKEENKPEKKEINTVHAFDKHIQKLNDAKTKRNSKEYEDIIKAVEWVNKTTTFDKGAHLTAEQRYATKLLVIKNSINEYIAHKAKKGVNKNVGDKLAVVEELNKEVSEKLLGLRGKFLPFLINGKEVNLSNIPITAEEEYNKAAKANPDGQMPNPSQKQCSTDDCMQRIIAKAVEKKYSPSHIEDLEEIRDELSDIEISKAKQPKQPTNGGLHM